MAGFEGSLCDGNLTINSVAMRCPAWWVLDLTPLWEPAKVRGSDRLIPGTNGVRPYRRRRTVTVKSLRMAITGEASRLGVANANVWTGLETNIDYLRTNVLDPVVSTEGTHSAVLTMPSGATRTEPIHVVSFEIGKQVNARCVAVLEVSIPSGVFA